MNTLTLLEVNNYVIYFSREVRRPSSRLHDEKERLCQTENYCLCERGSYLKVLDKHFGKDRGLKVKVRVLLLKQHLPKEKMCDIHFKVQL